MDRHPTSISHKYTDFRSLQLIAAIPHERANARAPDTSENTKQEDLKQHRALRSPWEFTLPQVPNDSCN